MTKIFDLDAQEIRRTKPEDLELPDLPEYLNQYDKFTLVKILDRLTDYWAAWYQKASFLPEDVAYKRFTPATLRRLIKLLMDEKAADLFAMDASENSLWDSHIDGLFKKWDRIVQKERKAASAAETRETKLEIGDLETKRVLKKVRRR